jgi:hypothetical protein
MIVLLYFLSLGLALSIVFSVWAISRDVRKIREHFDRVDRLAMQKLGYTPRPAPATDPRKPATNSGKAPKGGGILGLETPKR